MKLQAKIGIALAVASSTATAILFVGVMMNAWLPVILLLLTVLFVITKESQLEGTLPAIWGMGFGAVIAKFTIEVTRVTGEAFGAFIRGLF